MIKWSQSRTGKLNGVDCVFAVTQGRGRAYAYFVWNNELLVFYTGEQTLDHGEEIWYQCPMMGALPAN
ncbi:MULTISPECIES: hypothetical protein [Paraburkholderia]|uniref:hypothetical protein n=1 Tax=Paraburkholderia TaxID=1822464 RepID=UPI002AB13FB7|nr:MULTISPECIES: hypothetical protein [Paraburkholderia]